ncbi:MAG: hypothetical protein FWF88_05895 [Peptococcaceae bacterium]|nr:hypothetical protein [Peptococcaceae bacterium]
MKISSRLFFFVGLFLVSGFIPISFFFGSIFSTLLMICLGFLGAVFMLIGGIQSARTGRPKPLILGLIVILVVFSFAFPLSCVTTDTLLYTIQKRL